MGNTKCTKQNDLTQSEYTNYAEESTHHACFFFLGFDSLQFSVNCPTTPALPARRVSCDLALSHTKSEGLGDFSLLNNETTQTLTSWLGSWESSGSLPELSKAAEPLLLLVHVY